MTLTDRDKKVLIFVMPVIAVVAYWFLLLSPKREEASRAAEEVVAQQQRRDAAQAKLSAANSAQRTSLPATPRSSASARRFRPLWTCRA